jgi:hypothetical protein
MVSVMFACRLEENSADNSIPLLTMFDCVENCERRGDKGFLTRKRRAGHQIRCRHMRALEEITFPAPEPDLPDDSTRASKRRRTDDIGLDIIDDEVCTS